MASPTDDGADGTGGSNRRGFIGGVAALAATASLGGLAGTSLADQHGSSEGNSAGDGSSGDNGGTSEMSKGPSDLEILNYALTLEHLENEFYVQQLDQFSECDFRQSDLLDGCDDTMRTTAREYVRTVQEHEQAHVDFLTKAIEAAGGTPVSAATEYNFGAPLGQDGIETVEQFTGVAQVLESTGVDAYAGAAPLIDDAGSYVPPALEIHSVEANHAAFVRTLNGDNPMPVAFNEAKSVEAVLDAVGPIIVEQ